MPDPFATSQDVENAWRALSDDEHAVAAQLAEYASVMVRGRWSDVDDRIADGRLDARLARLAVVQMVRRVLVNPDGARSRSEGIGQYRETVDWGEGGVAAHALEITPAEVRLLAPTGTRSTVGTIHVRPGLIP